MKFKKYLLIFLMSMICNSSFAQADAPTNLSLKGIVDWTRNFNYIMTGETLPTTVPAKGIWFIQWTGSVPKLYVSDGATWTNFQSASVVDGSITTSKLANSAVTAEKISTSAVTTEKINNFAVETSKLANNAVTNDKLGILAIDTTNIRDGVITSDKLAVDSVTSNKIVDGAITSNKIASNLNEKTISLNNGELATPSLKFTSSINTGLSYNASDSAIILGWLGDEKASISQNNLSFYSINDITFDSGNDVEFKLTASDTNLFSLKKWSLNNSLDLRLYNNLGGYLMSPIAIGATGSVIINNGQGYDYPVDDGIHNLQVNGSMIAGYIDVASLTVTDISSTNITTDNINAVSGDFTTLIVDNPIASLSVVDLNVNNLVATTSNIVNETATNLTSTNATISNANLVNATSTVMTVNNLNTKLVDASLCPFFTCGEPSTLVGGDWRSDGYFGEVSGANLIYGWELLRDLWGMDASTITSKSAFTSAFAGTFGSDISYQFTGTGYTGTEDNLEVEWLKFVSDGKIIFIAKRPLLNNITWNEILDKIPDYENGTDIKIPASRLNSNYTNGYVTLKCRLLTGANHNPMFGDINDRGKAGVKLGAGSEWNRLMYRVCNQIPTDTHSGASSDYSGGAQVGDNWANFTGSQLGFGGIDTIGRVTWCQELCSYNGSAYQYRVRRGSEYGVGIIHNNPPSYRGTDIGFRPALILESK